MCFRLRAKRAASQCGQYRLQLSFHSGKRAWLCDGASARCSKVNSPASAVEEEQAKDDAKDLHLDPRERLPL